jgi:hypothetical protein
MFSREMRREKSGVNELSCVLTVAAWTVNQAKNQTLTRAKNNMIFWVRYLSKGAGDSLHLYPFLDVLWTLQHSVTVESPLYSDTDRGP